MVSGQCFSLLTQPEVRYIRLDVELRVAPLWVSDAAAKAQQDGFKLLGLNYQAITLT